MRKMTGNEIEALLATFGWATLCMVDPEGKPYAIEFSYFLDRLDICGMVHPRGRTAECLRGNPAVVVKICDTDPRCRDFRAASCFGEAAFEFLTDQHHISFAWDQLEQKLGLEPGTYTAYKRRYLASGRPLPLLRVKVARKSGVISGPNRGKKHDGAEEQNDAMVG